jgi:hypothetical protein
VFWLIQIIRVPVTDIEFFEDHKHKLLWLIVVAFVPLIGAVWFAVWRHQIETKRQERRAQQTVEKIADAFQAERDA